MKTTPGNLNAFLMFKLPSAWLCGVRIKEISKRTCKVGVRHQWINQNPFNSMYFAVQAMAAELSTGALVMQEINQSRHKISMLVKQNEAAFVKKATGRIIFECHDGEKIRDAIAKATETGEGEVFWMHSTGRNAQGEQVSAFHFEWTIKLKLKK